MTWLEDAVRKYERAIQYDAADREAWLGKAEALAQAGRYEEALPCYDVAIRLDPAHARSHWGRALALESLGRTPEAIHSVRHALRLLRGRKRPPA